MSYDGDERRESGGEGSSLPQLYRQPGALAELRPDFVAPETEDDSISFRHLLRILMRRKWLVAAVAATVLAIGLIQTFTATPIYRASAIVQIDPAGPQVLPYESISEAQVTPRSAEAYLWTQARKLRTRALARRVIDRLELRDDPVFSQDVSGGFFLDAVKWARGTVKSLFSGGETLESDNADLDRFVENVSTALLRDTRLIEVSYSAPGRKLSADVANAVVEEFIQSHFDSSREVSAQATEFLEGQLKDLKAKIEDSEKALIDYARANDIVNVGDRETVNLEKLEDLTDEMTRVENELHEKTALWESLRSATPENFPPQLRTLLIDDLSRRLSHQDEHLASLRASHGPNWPEVISTEREVAEIEEQLVAEKRRAIQAARADYQVAVERYRKLTRSVGQQREVVDRLNDDSIELNILKREVETNRAIYDGLLQRLKETGVSASLQSSSIRLVERADPPRGVTAPKKSRDLVLSLMLGLFLGVVAAFVTEGFDNSLKTAEDVLQHLRLPTLGVIPALQTVGSKPKKALFNLKRSKNAPRQPILTVQERLEHPEWSLEAYRSLRTSILLSHSGKPPQTIQVTSALPGEGKSTTVANVALTLAQGQLRPVVTGHPDRLPQSVRGAGGSCGAQSGGVDQLRAHGARTQAPGRVLLVHRDRHSTDARDYRRGGSVALCGRCDSGRSQRPHSPRGGSAREPAPLRGRCDAARCSAQRRRRD
jgi:uncharacterized protein involved in exopolysaccharide biosynthesis